MTSSKPIFYDLVATTNRAALSPWCWHAKMALAHKGFDVDTMALTFTEKDQVIAAGGKTYPLLIETDGTISDDSKAICLRLEEICPKPTLFPEGTAGLAAYDFLHRYVQTILMPTMAKMVVKDIPDVLSGADREYFIKSREARFGMSLDEFCSDRDNTRTTIFNLQLDPFRQAMQRGGYVSGDSPAMLDYLLFGQLQWARVCSPYQLLDKDDPIAPWMEKMLDLFDGLGRKTPAAK